MKLILILSVCLSVAFAQIRLHPGLQYDHQEGFNSHAAESESDNSYYLNAAGVSNPYAGYIPSSNQVLAGQYPTGSSFGFTEQHNSKEAARELAESYYKNLAINGGGAHPWVSGLSGPSVSGGSLDWTEQSSRKEAERQLAESYYKNLALNGGGAIPWVSGSSGPSVSGGSLGWTEQSSRKEAERQLVESYYKNLALNGGGSIPWVSGSSVPSISGGSLDWTEQSSRKEAERQLAESYYKNLAFNGGGAWSPPSSGIGAWSLPSVRPLHPSYLPSGNSFDLTEQHSSKEAARQLEQSYYNNLAINRGVGGLWPVHPRPQLLIKPLPSPSVPRPIPTPLPSPSVGAGSFNFHEQLNSYNAIKEAENSYIRNLIVNGGGYVPGQIKPLPAIPSLPSSSLQIIPSLPSPRPQILPSFPSIPSLPSVSYPLPSRPSPPVVLPQPSPLIYGGSVFGLNEQSNSHSSSSESESSHSQNLQVSSPWAHTLGVPPPIHPVMPVIPPGVTGQVVLPSPSVPSAGGSFDFTELMKSYQASKEAENSYLKNINLNSGGIIGGGGVVGGGILGGSGIGGGVLGGSSIGGGVLGGSSIGGGILGGSGIGGSILGGSAAGGGSIFGGSGGGAIGGINGGAIWPGVASYYPSREISESFRDSSSLSESDQSNYWNKLLATNQGIASESGGSQNRQKDAASDLAYDFSDRQTGYPVSLA